MGDVPQHGGEHRGQRPPEGVAHHDGPLPQALGPGGEDVVLPQGLQAGGAGLLDQLPQAADAHHPGREGQVAQDVPHAGEHAVLIHALGGQPAQEHREEEHPHQAQEKAGHAEAHQAQGGGRPIPARAGPPGRQNTQGEGQQNGQ